MTNEQEKIVEQELQKRKELSRVRIFWLLLAIDAALIVYLVLQFVMLTQK